jgi:hypothetical protein
MAVVVDNGKIARIVKASSVIVTGTAQTIDASDKYVVPGYLDMHAHVVDRADMQTTLWPLLIANGITGFRQMSGSPELLARGQRLRQEIAAGTVVAPEPLVLVGRLFNLTPDGGRAGITTPAAAIAEVLDQKRAGTDFIKVINVNREVFLATMEEAKKHGLDVVGHLFPSVSGTDASNAGMRAYEHLGALLGNILFDCSIDGPAARGTDSSGHRPRPAAGSAADPRNHPTGSCNSDDCVAAGRGGANRTRHRHVQRRPVPHPREFARKERDLAGGDAHSKQNDADARSAGIPRRSES